jgi:hypothetical protein
MVSIRLCKEERHHGEEDKKESESEEEKVIFRIGIKLPLMPIGLETLVGTSAAGNIQPLFLSRLACHDRRGEPSIFDATILRLWRPLPAEP